MRNRGQKEIKIRFIIQRGSAQKGFPISRFRCIKGISLVEVYERVGKSVSCWVPRENGPRESCTYQQARMMMMKMMRRRRMLMLGSDYGLVATFIVFFQLALHKVSVMCHPPCSQYWENNHWSQANRSSSNPIVQTAAYQADSHEKAARNSWFSLIHVKNLGQIWSKTSGKQSVKSLGRV